jgi:hypothetical protein
MTRLAIIALLVLVAAGADMGARNNALLDQLKSLPSTCAICGNGTMSPSPFQGGTCEPGYTLLWRQDYSAVCARDLEPVK